MYSWSNMGVSWGARRPMYKLCSFRPEQSVRWKDSKLVVPVQLYIAVSSLTYIGCFKFQVLIGLFSLYEIKLFTKSSIYLLAAHSQTQFEPLKEMIRAGWMYSDLLMSCDSTEETLGSSHGEQVLSRVFCPDTLQTKCAPCFGISEIGLIWWGQAEYLLSFLEGEGWGWGLNEVRLFQRQWCGKKYGWKRPKLLCSVSTSKSVTTPTQLLNTSQTLRRCDLNSNPTALQCECMQGGRLPACTLQSGQGSDCACDAGGPAPCKLFCFEMQFKQKLMDRNLSQALYLYLNLFFLLFFFWFLAETPFYKWEESSLKCSLFFSSDIDTYVSFWLSQGA